MFGRPRILTWSEGWITPVATWHATAEDREDALDRFRSLRLVRELQSASARHYLVSLYEIATGRELYSPRDVRDHTLVAAIEDALSRRTMLLVPGWMPGAPDRTRARSPRAGAATEDDGLIAAVMGERTSLEFDGRKYRFVVLDRAPYRSSGRGNFLPVPAAQARELLTRMSERFAKTPEQRASWQRLADKVTDGRGGGEIILMRNAPAAAAGATRIEAPATTPSQARQSVALLDWIEIDVEYDDGRYFGGNCAIELPGGRRTDGSAGADGVVRLDGIVAGTCKVSLPDLDGEAWGPVSS